MDRQSLTSETTRGTDPDRCVVNGAKSLKVLVQTRPLVEKKLACRHQSSKAQWAPPTVNRVMPLPRRASLYADTNSMHDRVLCGKMPPHCIVPAPDPGD